MLLGGTADENGDALLGNGGNDALFGGPGTDTLTGGDGSDYMTGDAGADRLFLRDNLVDRWCDSAPLQLEVDPPHTEPLPTGPFLFPGDKEVCPADEF